MTEKKTCFVILPVEGDSAAERKSAEEVLARIIKPAVHDCGYSTVRLRTTPSFKVAPSDIKHILFEPLVVADLTGGNPIVFYALALRHAVGKPCVQIIATNQQKKIDVHGMHAIPYDLSEETGVSEARNEIVKNIREMEKNAPSPKNPVSNASVIPWTPSLGMENASFSSHEAGHAEEVLKSLLKMPRSEVLPALLKYIEDLTTKDPRVEVLGSPQKDLSAAIGLILNVPNGGHISATSSLHYDEDADSQGGYRTAVNQALKERNVTYRKVICASAEKWPLRHEKWSDEFREKVELINAGKIKPGAIEVLHHPSPMFVDVLISQNEKRECLEMVVGFGAGGGKHSGFRTKDGRVIIEWLNVYLESRIIEEAGEHTKNVLENKEECHCSELLHLLENAGPSSSSPTDTRPRRNVSKARKSDSAPPEGPPQNSPEAQSKRRNPKRR